ncbi:TPA: hypothetical protein ACG5DM_002394 [Pseudomonas putida]
MSKQRHKRARYHRIQTGKAETLTRWINSRRTPRREKDLTMHFTKKKASAKPEEITTINKHNYFTKAAKFSHLVNMIDHAVRLKIIISLPT